MGEPLGSKPADLDRKGTAQLAVWPAASDITAYRPRAVPMLGRSGSTWMRRRPTHP